MSAIALDPLIAEARRRARRRWLLGMALAAAIAGVALGLVVEASRPAAKSDGTSVVATVNACGITVAGMRILQAGETVYREPGPSTNPRGGPPAQVQCSGGSVWVVWRNGGEMSQQAYFGVHSSDAGRTWRPVFAELYFGRKAPHELDSYFGPWTLRGTAAYFVGSCPACDASPVSLYVTKDAGETFRTVRIAALDGFVPTRVTASRRFVTIVGERGVRGGWAHKTATVRVG